MRALTACTILAAASTLIGCGYHIHRVPETPAALRPRIPVLPPPPIAGQGRVAIEVVDGPTAVQWLKGVRWTREYYTTYRTETRGNQTVTISTTHSYNVAVPDYQPLCTTPCLADLPLGHRTLRFVPIENGVLNEMQNDFADVTFEARPGVYRRVLSRIRVNAEWYLGKLAFAAGLLATAAGPIIMIGGDPEKVDVVPIGLAVTVGGAALTALGIWAMFRYQTDLWPGVGVEWHPDDGAIMEVGPPRPPVRRVLDEK